MSVLYVSADSSRAQALEMSHVGFLRGPMQTLGGPHTGTGGVHAGIGGVTPRHWRGPMQALGGHIQALQGSHAGIGGVACRQKAYMNVLLRRYRCAACRQDFCGECRVTPYHSGLTCQQQRAPKCLYCQTPLLDDPHFDIETYGPPLPTHCAIACWLCTFHMVL